VGVPLGVENLVNGRRVVARSARDRKFDSAPTSRSIGYRTKPELIGGGGFCFFSTHFGMATSRCLAPLFTDSKHPMLRTGTHLERFENTCSESLQNCAGSKLLSAVVAICFDTFACFLYSLSPF
jgi:hypothetical protein